MDDGGGRAARCGLSTNCVTSLGESSLPCARASATGDCVELPRRACWSSAAAAFDFGRETCSAMLTNFGRTPVRTFPPWLAANDCGSIERTRPPSAWRIIPSATSKLLHSWVRSVVSVVNLECLRCRNRFSNAIKYDYCVFNNVHICYHARSNTYTITSICFSVLIAFFWCNFFQVVSISNLEGTAGFWLSNKLLLFLLLAQPQLDYAAHATLEELWYTRWQVQCGGHNDNLAPLSERRSGEVSTWQKR